MADIGSLLHSKARLCATVDYQSHVELADEFS